MAEKFVELATKALRTVGVIGRGVPPSGYDVDVAFQASHDMFDAFAAQRLTVFQTIRNVLDLVNDGSKGGPLDPYTIGVGGDFNLARPTWIPNANLLCLTTNPPFEYPLYIYEPDEYATVAIKDMQSAMATSIFFDGKFDTSGPDVGLGDLFLYPVPNGQMPVKLVLYLPRPMNGFADKATTEYTFPPGYAEMLRYQLALRLSTEYQMPLSAEHQQLVRDTFAVIERPNVPIPNLRCDFGVPGTGAVSGLYNWRTGTNTRLGNR